MLRLYSLNISFYIQNREVKNSILEGITLEALLFRVVYHVFVKHLLGVKNSGLFEMHVIYSHLKITTNK